MSALIHSGSSLMWPALEFTGSSPELDSPLGKHVQIKFAWSKIKMVMGGYDHLPKMFFHTSELPQDKPKLSTSRFEWEVIHW